MRYQMGRYTFATKEEYEAGKRDARKIRNLADTDGSDLERSKKILKRVYQENIEFESWVGKDFMDRLRDHVKMEERRNSAGKRVWFYVKYPLTAVIAAVLISQFLRAPLDGIRSHSFFQYMREEKESSDERTKQPVFAEGSTQDTAKEDTLGMQEEEKKKKASPAETKKKPEDILPAYRSLWEKNHDLCGWLTIEGTNIDYPVMFRKKDEEYYLHRNFEKKEDINGMLVLDQRCDLSRSGEQHIIYGHNMRSGAMFGELMNYKTESYYQQHPEILLDSLFTKERYEILSVYLSRIFYEDEDVFKFYEYSKFSSKKEFRTFYRNIKENALYDTGVAAKYGDTLLTLVTCEYSQDNGRLVVTARRVDG